MSAGGTQKAMIAMSGGVDSSVAALLAIEAGFDATGVTCKMFGSNVLGDDALEAFMDEVDDAKRVCRSLGIEHFVFNYKDVFERCVIRKFVDSYLRGETPNPCVDCNRHVKFGALQRRRSELGFDVLATGHYAQVAFDETAGRWTLLRARHVEKDQSYMLCRLSQDDLAHSLFPLGALSKDEVRDLAMRAGFGNARKRESQDICFIPDGDYAGFIEWWTDRGMDAGRNGDEPRRGEGHEGDLGNRGVAETAQRGPIESADGKVLGQHDGLFRYTVGQRKGIGIAAGKPLYVIGKDSARNALVVGAKEQLLTKSVTADEVNFVSLAPEEAEGRGVPVLAKASYRQAPRPATARFSGDHVVLELDEPIPRPAPGQTLALYDATGQAVLVGATIR